MRNLLFAILATAILAVTLPVNVVAQDEGDYRSSTKGDWSATSTWEVYDSGNWVAASTAPTGSETITVVGDTVWVDAAVSVTGNVIVEEGGVLRVSDGTLEFADGSVYEHARDEGSIPEADWLEGSTTLFTGIELETPADRGQDYYNLTLNTPDMLGNKDLDLGGNTIGGDLTVISSGESRWRLIGGENATITIMGDVIVEEGAQFETLGTGDPVDVVVDHYGDIQVNGGAFSISRGSQGNGTGSTTWNLYEGDFTMADAETRNSNPTPGNAKVVFASGGTQQLTFENVDYTGGDIHFAVSDSTTLEVADGFESNGLFANEGEVEAQGDLTFLDGSVYEHARDGGSVPEATWAEGSTALFTGITSDAPDDRGQDYYNLTLNTPNMGGNDDLDLGGHTISGDLTAINSGGSRWRLMGGDNGTITIMGDVIVEEDAQLETMGSGDPVDIVVDHYGDIQVNGGAFSVSRGSQGNGTGSTLWYLHEGDVTMTNAETRNSNPTPGNARFIFASDSTQHLVIEGSADDSNIETLSVEVADSTTLDLGTSVIRGDGVFWLQDGATLATAHADGLAGNFDVEGDADVDFGTQANFTYNGTEMQWLDAMLPDTLHTLTIANSDTVVSADTNYVAMLAVDEAAALRVDSTGSVTVAEGGNVDGAIVNGGELITEDEAVLEFGATAVYEHARDEGGVPSGNWAEGSTALFTGIELDAPENRGQDYYNLTLNTPGMLGNKDLDLGGNTIGGDLTVISSGESRWRLIGGENDTITIMGDVIVEEGAQFETMGSGDPVDVEVHHYGDIQVNGGALSVSRGSQGNGTGSTLWYLYEGDVTMTNAETRNSNPTPGNARFIFASGDTQHLTIEGDPDDSNIETLSVEVADSTTLDLGTSVIRGDGVFWLQDGATLATAHGDGVAGNFDVEDDAEVDLSEAANFTFNGSDAQVTSELMPTTVNGLTIDNEAGVTLSQETTINGVLRLAAGEFDNTIPFTLGPEGTMELDGGSLLVPVSTTPQGDVPTEFALHQNYPNPFNPSTTIRYDIKERSEVTIKVYDVMGREVAQLVDGERGPGRYQVEWDAQDTASGVYYYQIRTGDWSATRSLTLVK